MSSTKSLHEIYLKRCLELADHAKQAGESPVGSVVVKAGKIIGEGFEKSRQLQDVTRHAEVVALLNALENGFSLSGATLYTNVEPCVLCTYAIRHYQIETVVFLTLAGELGGGFGKYPVLKADNLATWTKPPQLIHFQEHGR